jgi:hypothetical protein
VKNHAIQSITEHFKHCINAGFHIWLTIGVFLGLIFFAFDFLIVNPAGVFITSPSFVVLALVVAFHVLLIYGFGVVVHYTAFVSWLKERLKNHSILLNIARVLPDPTHRREHEFVNLEVFYYESETARMRGYLSSEPILTREGEVWIPVHFDFPPTPKTGGAIKEFRADDPNLRFTGRRLRDHITYIVTWGGGVENEEGKSVEKITAEIREKLLCFALRKASK